MAETITLFLWEVDLLYALMCRQLKDYCEENKLDYPEGNTLITGNNKPKKEKNETEEQREKRINAPSLSKLIAEHPAVVAYLIEYNQKPIKKYGRKGRKRIAGSKIYELTEELKNFSNQFREVKLHDIYCHVFFIFIGCKDLDGFKYKAYLPKDFVGFYYSLQKNEICRFHLSMLIIQPKLELKFAHATKATLSHFDEIDSNIELQGNIVLYRDSWTVQFSNNDVCLNLSIHKNRTSVMNDKTPDDDFFYGFITGTNSQGQLFNAEIILVKGTPDANSALIIRRYLNLRGNYASLKMEEQDLKSVENLQIDNVNIQRIEDYAKTYRLLTATPEGAILQSRFSIAEDYSCTICVPGIEKSKPLRCRLILSNTPAGRLVVFAYREKFILYTITSIEIPKNRPAWKPINNILKGTFFIANANVMTAPADNKFVMSEESKPFEPKYYSPKEVQNLKQDEIIGPLLVELWNEKFPKIT
jgi:hypothetical protein